MEKKDTFLGSADSIGITTVEAVLAGAVVTMVAMAEATLKAVAITKTETEIVARVKCYAMSSRRHRIP